MTLAYRQSDLPRPLDGYGYVIPRREGRRALACTWTSTKFPHRAPEGYALIRVFVGRAGQDIPWNEKDLLALAKEELSSHWESLLSRSSRVSLCGTKPCRNTISDILKSSSGWMRPWKSIPTLRWQATAIAALAFRIASIRVNLLLKSLER